MNLIGQVIIDRQNWLVLPHKKFSPSHYKKLADELIQSMRDL